jgi:hypothetical protein
MVWPGVFFEPMPRNCRECSKYSWYLNCILWHPVGPWESVVVMNTTYWLSEVIAKNTAQIMPFRLRTPKGGKLWGSVKFSHKWHNEIGCSHLKGPVLLHLPTPPVNPIFIPPEDEQLKKTWVNQDWIKKMGSFWWEGNDLKAPMRELLTSLHQGSHWGTQAMSDAVLQVYGCIWSYTLAKWVLERCLVEKWTSKSWDRNQLEVETPGCDLVKHSSRLHWDAQNRSS